VTLRQDQVSLIKEADVTKQAIPEQYLDLFQKRAYAHLATLMPDGSPQVSPVWVDLQDGTLIVNSARGRQKDRNMRRDARVAVEIQDPENPYRFLLVRGRVIKITEEGADASIDRLAFKYLGQEKYPNRRPGEVRIIYQIEPEHVTAR
jgi:PPOX class probable F420-dependent enzyme